MLNNIFKMHAKWRHNGVSQVESIPQKNKHVYYYLSVKQFTGLMQTNWKDIDLEIPNMDFKIPRYDSFSLVFL